MLIHALQDMQIGQELTLTYTDPDTPLEQRSKAIRSRGFTCTCELCTQQAALPNQQWAQLKTDIDATRTRVKSPNCLRDTSLSQDLATLCERATALTPTLNYQVLLSDICSPCELYCHIPLLRTQFY